METPIPIPSEKSRLAMACPALSFLRFRAPNLASWTRAVAIGVGTVVLLGLVGAGQGGATAQNLPGWAEPSRQGAAETSRRAEPTRRAPSGRAPARTTPGGAGTNAGPCPNPNNPNCDGGNFNPGTPGKGGGGGGSTGGPSNAPLPPAGLLILALGGGGWAARSLRGEED
jgi:hypothetical protein